MRLDVLHVHAGNLYGGVETILVNLARHAEAAPDVAHRFALCFDGRLAAEVRDAGARLYLIGAVRISRPWTVVRARRRLRDLLASSRFDAAVCHSAWSQAIFGPVLRGARVPSVFWLHGAARGPAWLDRWARRSPPAHAVCVSRFVASALPRLFPGLRHTVISPPVAAPVAASPQQRAERRRALGARENDVVILQASRMEKGKGHRVLLEALTTLANVPGWGCWVAGGWMGNCVWCPPNPELCMCPPNMWCPPNWSGADHRDDRGAGGAEHPGGRSCHPDVSAGARKSALCPCT